MLNLIFKRNTSLLLKLNNVRNLWLSRSGLPKKSAQTGGGKRSQSTQTSSESSESEQLIEELRKKLAENKDKNILVYSSLPGGGKINLIGMVGGLLLLATGYNTWYLFGSVRFKTRNIDDESGFFRSMLKIIGSDYFRISLCSVITFVGLISMVGSLLFTQRMVNKMYLLKGGKSIGLVTDGIFGRNSTYVLDLTETTFESHRRMRTPQVTFKNKKHFFYFLMNNVDGQYHEKTLFDHVICTKR